jgi:cysteine synthase
MIGNTPMIDISAMANPKVPGVVVLGKAEFMNPGFSMKDRIVQHIFNCAEERGLLKPGMTVVAASSGNTGASVAMISAMRGYKAVIITNAKCSKEKCDAIRAYGAELMITPDGVDYMQKETDLAIENPSWFSVNQYDNLDNPQAHYQGTGAEIYQQTFGRVTHFVAAGSTGGTVSGVGRYLKQKLPGVKILMADPVGSIFYDYWKTGKVGTAGKFLVEGVGKNNIPGAMDFSVVDGMLQVTDLEAFQTCRDLACKEGICVGGSAGLNVAAAIRLANEATEPCVIVTILCDLGVKYLSKVYNPEYLAKNGVELRAGL